MERRLKKLREVSMLERTYHAEPENLPADPNLWKTLSSRKQFGMLQEEVNIVEEQW